MRPELETYHNIDRYLNKELQGEELLQFESRLATDPSFVQEVELMKMTNLVITSSSYDQLRKQMSADIQLRDRKASVRKKSVVGGSVLLAVGVAACVYLATENVADPIKNIDLNEGKPLVTETASHYATSDTKVAEFSKEKVIPSKQVKSSTQQVGKIEATKPAIQPVPVEPKVALPAPSLQPSEPHVAQSETMKHVSENTVKAIISDTPIHLPAQEKEEPVHTAVKEEAKPNKFTIQPSYGETWKVPANHNKPYVLTIHNSAGQLVFQHKSHDSPLSEWDGIGTTGTVLDAGLYIYVIEYQDGTREAGNITIAK